MSVNYIGKNLRFLRKRKKLSQAQLAENLGLNRGNIASYEKGGSFPNPQRLLQIARYFGVAMDRLIDENLEKSFQESDKPVKKNRQEFTPFEKLKFQADRYNKIISGLVNYHQYRKEKLKSGKEVPANSNYIYDVERLLDLAKGILKQNQEMLSQLEHKSGN